MRHRPLQSAQARVVCSCGCSDKRRGWGAYLWKRKSGKSPSLVAEQVEVVCHVYVAYVLAE